MNELSYFRKLLFSLLEVKKCRSDFENLDHYSVIDDVSGVFIAYSLHKKIYVGA